MKKIFGFVVGVVWLVFAGVAYRNSAAGWSGSHSDLGFWWAVIAVFLTIAAGAAIVGTVLHTRARAD